MILYILGNGFDVAHNLPTRYSDFECFMKNTYPVEKMRYENIYTNGSELWSDFENNLVKIEFDYLLSDLTKDMLYMGEQPAIDVSEGSWCYEEIYKRLPSSEKLQNYFAEWCSSIPVNVKNRLFLFSGNALFINFNYTSVLEDIYRIKDSQILHIHGYVKDKEVEKTIIVGHSEAIFNSDSHIGIPEEEDYEDPNNLLHLVTNSAQQPMVDALCDYFNSLNKRVNTRLSELKCFLLGRNIEKVRVFGHSMDKADIQYFTAIRDYIGVEIPWEIALYGKADSEENKKRIGAFLGTDDKIQYVSAVSVPYKI